jgi:hypothetical protein
LYGHAQEKGPAIAGPGPVEAAGFEPASASAPSARFYERSSRFTFALLDGPGRRRVASPLNVPPVPRDQGPEGEAHSMTPGTGPWAARTDGRCYLSSGSQFMVGVYFVAGVLRVSSKLGSSRWTRTAHVETGRPQTMHILPFWSDLSIRSRGAVSGGGAPSWRAPSRVRRCGARSHAACRTASCGWRPRARALCCRLWSRASRG